MEFADDSHLPYVGVCILGFHIVLLHCTFTVLYSTPKNRIAINRGHRTLQAMLDVVMGGPEMD